MADILITGVNNSNSFSFMVEAHNSLELLSTLLEKGWTLLGEFENSYLVISKNGRVFSFEI